MINNMTKKIKIECSYLDSIQRQNLDFDLIPQCSVCLSTTNILCCLVCGKYFEGIGTESHSFIHSLEKDHHLFIHLETQEILCLPDNFHVYDSDLDDIQYNLRPSYTIESLKSLESQIITKRTLDGHKIVIGLIPLNNLKASTYANVIIYSLFCISELRGFWLLNNYSGLTQALGQICKKMWNEKSFRNHLCPHEFFQLLSKLSMGKFNYFTNNDPQLFLP